MLLRIAGMASLVSLSLNAVSAQAFSLLGQGRYLSMTPEKTDQNSDPKAATGMAVGASAQLTLVDFKVGGVFAGAGLDYWGLSESDADLKFARMSVPAEVGVSFNAIPVLTFQLSGLFDYSIYSKGTSEDLATLTYSTTNDMAYGVNARALMTVAPFVRAGLIAQYLTGSYKIKVDEIEGLPDVDAEAFTKASEDETFKHSGYAIGAVVGVSF